MGFAFFELEPNEGARLVFTHTRTPNVQQTGLAVELTLANLKKHLLVSKILTPSVPKNTSNHYFPVISLDPNNRDEGLCQDRLALILSVASLKRRRILMDNSQWVLNKSMDVSPI